MTTAEAAASKSTSPRLSVAIRCDASQEIGLGHLVRQLALAEELRARGHRVVMVGTYTDSDLATRLLIRSHLVAVPAEDDRLDQQLRSLDVDVVILDGYRFPPYMGQRLMDGGFVVVAMVDGEYGLPQGAHIFVDQNFGAERPATVPERAVYLAGSDYVLLRDAVLQMRRERRQLPPRAVPRVLTVLGGTDAAGLTESVVRLLLRTGIPVEVVAITPDLAARESISGLPVSPAQAVTAIAPIDDLASMATMYDAVVAAAGSTVWELLYLGVPIGLVSVAANQAPAYVRLKTSKLVSAIGTLSEILSTAGENEQLLQATRDFLLQATRDFLGDDEMREIHSRAGMAVVDGLGRARVAAWIEQLAWTRAELLDSCGPSPLSEATMHADATPRSVVGVAPSLQTQLPPGVERGEVRFPLFRKFRDRGGGGSGRAEGIGSCESHFLRANTRAKRSF